MLEWTTYKGIPAGKIIAFNLAQMGYTQAEFAKTIGIQPQILNAIIKGHRQIPLETSLKMDEIFGLESGFFAFVQLQNQIKAIKEKNMPVYEGVPNIRRVVFWDCDFDKMNWSKYKDFAIKRVMDYGNEEEKQEIRRFYGIH